MVDEQWKGQEMGCHNGPAYIDAYLRSTMKLTSLFTMATKLDARLAIEWLVFAAESTLRNIDFLPSRKRPILAILRDGVPTTSECPQLHRVPFKLLLPRELDDIGWVKVPPQNVMPSLSTLAEKENQGLRNSQNASA